MENLGRNVTFKIEGNTLILVIDMSKTLGPSASGKTTLIASTGGGVKIPGTELTVNLSSYRK